ncbi:uncharacterized protein LOC115237578 [Formica exsecta]|uniref:uncharacterized protein LOC115237578 n=1 Tax=Formica exsecta TaxID=72781 RepID=UPI0011436648|nr:uncharacterized protein LOC115237578 [Formica exsecta]
MDESGNTDDTIKGESRCFVCDAEVQGRFYALATCRTQNSQTRVIEKLGELVGERYMVVISEDDVICRSCAILINTLDRLETEMHNIRDHVLRFLEQKYSLEDGELRGGGDKPKPCQPPQITKSSSKEITDYSCKQNEIDLETEGRKISIEEDSKIQENSHSWLQCDKCKYTTRLNSFMMYHLRDHAKQRAFCDKCGLCISENQQDIRHSCTKINKSRNKENEKDNSDTIARNDSMKTLFLEKTLQPTLPLTQTTPPPLIGLSSCDHLYISNILPANDPTSSKQSMSILKPVNMVDIDISSNMTKSSESNPVQEEEIKTRNESRKQILTLTDDGTVELVEVPCWKET